MVAISKPVKAVWHWCTANYNGSIGGAYLKATSPVEVNDRFRAKYFPTIKGVTLLVSPVDFEICPAYADRFFMYEECKELGDLRAEEGCEKLKAILTGAVKIQRRTWFTCLAQNGTNTQSDPEGLGFLEAENHPDAIEKFRAKYFADRSDMTITVSRIVKCVPKLDFQTRLLPADEAGKLGDLLQEGRADLYFDIISGAK